MHAIASEGFTLCCPDLIGPFADNLFHYAATVVVFLVVVQVRKVECVFTGHQVSESRSLGTAVVVGFHHSLIFHENATDGGVGRPLGFLGHGKVARGWMAVEDLRW